MIFHRILIPAFAAAALLVAGCGPKPSAPSIPVDTSIDSVLVALKHQSSRIDTFSGWAKVRAKDGRNEESATAVIAYRRPDEFKTTLLGFGGMELAEIASQGDSVVAFIPFYNGYLTVPKGENPLRTLVPGFNLDLDKLLSVLAGPSLPPLPRETYRTTLTRWPNRAELVSESGGTTYRYVVNGPEFLVTEETVTVDSVLVWGVSRSNFTAANGVQFPRHILVRDGRRSLSLDFTSISINSGLSVDDLTVTVPEDARRIPSRNR